LLVSIIEAFQPVNNWFQVPPVRFFGVGLPIFASIYKQTPWILEVLKPETGHARQV
jgi:hypothetical protein